MTNAELIQTIRAEIGKHLDALNKVKHLATFSEEHGYNHGFEDAMRDLLSFLDTLEEDRPEPYNPVYDEAYLNEKIKKATESWKGVDVDALLAECRWYDEEKSEKPMNQDELEKAVIDYFEGYWPGMETPEQCNTHLQFTPPAIMRLARHFAEWGADHAKIDVTDFCKPIDPSIAQCIADHSWEMLGEDEKPVPNDLEEAAENHIREVADAAGHPGWDWETQDIADAFIAGAKWQKEQDEKEQADLFTIVALDAAQRAKEQMMKDAEERMVESFSDMHPEISIPLNPTMFKVGDKVRIIILPKED